jgi:hypothetical protein
MRTSAGVRKIAGRPSPPRPDDEYRECRHHGRSLFRVYGSRWRCRRCVAAAVTKRHRAVRARLVAEAGGCCAICGYDRCGWNLHFHHVDPAQKAFSMTMASGKGLASYRAEASKCVLLCANCHGEVEAGLVPSPPAGTTFDAPEAPLDCGAHGIRDEQ